MAMIRVTTNKHCSNVHSIAYFECIQFFIVFMQFVIIESLNLIKICCSIFKTLFGEILLTDIVVFHQTKSNELYVYIYLIQNSQAVKKTAALRKAIVKKDVKSKVAAKKWL